VSTDPVRAAVVAPADAVLDNAVFHALTTTQTEFARRAGGALRYRDDVGPFFGVDALDDEGWASLAALAGESGVAVLFRDAVPTPPAPWTVPWQSQCYQMVLDAPVDGTGVHGIRPLDDSHIPAMIELVQLTKPGPFLPRTIELGGYVGMFDGDRLVAMAGERIRVPGWSEISAVCTHPDARGRGLAAALTTAVAAGIQQRGEVPYLHVEVNNHNARRVYDRLGFRVRRLVDVVLVRRSVEDVA
jgi:predicted GNAT family acetyltransferase